jgi:O-antigen/teichoic acid export membrane protein
LKNSLIYGIGNVSARIVGFILIPIYTKHLAVSEYGIIGILEITAQILLTVFGMSIENGLMRWYWDKSHIDKQKSIVFTVLSIVTFVALCMNLIFQPVAEELALLLFDNSKHSILIQLMVLSASLQMIILLPITLMRLQEKPVLFSVVSITRLVITLTLTIIFIVYLNRSIKGIYEAQIIGQVIVLLICAFYLARNLKTIFETKIIRAMVSYSLPLAFANISAIFLTVSDRYLIKFLLGIHEVGIYSLGFKTSNTIKVFLITSIQLALSPVNFKMMSDPDHKTFYSNVMVSFTYVVTIAVLFFSLYSREIIELISRNPAYWQAYQIIPIISFGYIFSVLKDTSAIGLHIVKNTKPFAYILILVLAINLALNMFLIPVLQIMGAAIANLTSQILFFVLVYIRSQKAYSIPYNLKKISIMILVSVIIIVIGTQINFSSGWINIGVKLLLLAAFPFMMMLLKVQSYKDLFYLKDLYNSVGKLFKRKSED